jgi:hypothetical protein
MELNLVTFGYLFLRLAPFVLVSFFSLASIFNQDYKGLVYLIGLIFACFGTSMIGKLLGLDPPESSNPEICNMITVGQTSNISDLPLGQTVFTYTFAYLLYSIVKYKYVKQNIPTLIFFPLLIIADLIWNIKNSCNTFIQLLASLILGGLFGTLWAVIIDSTNSTNLQYFSGVNTNKEVCSKPSKSTFRCNVYKNGKLIGGNISGPKND